MLFAACRLRAPIGAAWCGVPWQVKRGALMFALEWRSACSPFTVGGQSKPAPPPQSNTVASSELLLFGLGSCMGMLLPALLKGAMLAAVAAAVFCFSRKCRFWIPYLRAFVPSYAITVWFVVHNAITSAVLDKLPAEQITSMIASHALTRGAVIATSCSILTALPSHFSTVLLKLFCIVFCNYGTTFETWPKPLQVRYLRTLPVKTQLMSAIVCARQFHRFSFYTHIASMAPMDALSRTQNT